MLTTVTRQKTLGMVQVGEHVAGLGVVSVIERWAGYGGRPFVHLWGPSGMSVLGPEKLQVGVQEDIDLELDESSG